MSRTNNIVTSVSAFTTTSSTENISDNNIVCIDMENGRIGVNTSTPNYEIDVSGQIRCTTLFIGSTQVNPSGQLDLTVTGTDIIPNSNNSLNLGSTIYRWNNAYIRNISASFINVSGNIVPFINTSGSLGVSGNMWTNAYIKDISASNISINENINVSGNLEPLTSNNTSKLGSTSKLWSNAYIKDISVANISVSGNLNLLDTINVGENL